eukprot:CAMPEP_0172712656 /NCGR_PEP_ID=MMETSP1074-20121228/61223_1 /TAXON_ID=2916 /ORGANISM="Ceratium fusus, Strain PA161109" /LENGTH=66 /DNA_ID=CAMNT_0013536611 /DNA_START=591 /DNA_END=791 /DNA_ORIENTATION=+
MTSVPWIWTFACVFVLNIGCNARQKTITVQWTLTQMQLAMRSGNRAPMKRTISAMKTRSMFLRETP